MELYQQLLSLKPFDRYWRRKFEVCDRCGESRELAWVKGCLRCLKCGYKSDCDGF